MIRSQISHRVGDIDQLTGVPLVEGHLDIALQRDSLVIVQIIAATRQHAVELDQFDDVTLGQIILRA